LDLDVAYWVRGGGAADDEGAVVTVDGQFDVRHVDGDGTRAWMRPRGDLVAGEADDAAVGGPPLHDDRTGPGYWWRAGRAQPGQPADPGRAQRVARGAH